MGTGSRVILAILGIIGLLSGLFLVLFTLGLITAFTTGVFLFIGRLTGDFSYTFLGALLLVVGVVLLVFSAKGSKKERSSAEGTIVSFTETGEIRISFRAIESMVLNASRKIKGVREVNTRLNFTEQGLVIYLRIKVIPDMPIPTLVDELQNKVRAYVQEISGSSVAEVKVLVENIAQEKIEKKVR